MSSNFFDKLANSYEEEKLRLEAEKKFQTDGVTDERNLLSSERSLSTIPDEKEPFSTSDGSRLMDRLLVEDAEREHNELTAQQEKELRNTISTKLASKTHDMNLFGNTNPDDIALVRTWCEEIAKGTGTTLSLNIIERMIDEMILEITSLGKLHSLVEDPTVSEIMVNAPNEVWVERKGKLILTDVKFDNDDQVKELARKIAGHIGRRVDNTNPIEDCRLPDGSRVNIIIPPISMKGTTITIRKFFKDKMTIDDLIQFGTITKEAATFIEAAVISGANIIVSGGTGSGKTTTLNILSNFIPNDERVITIEDSAELQLSNEHVVKLESRPANAEGTGAVTIRDCIKSALRMRPERIIVGEVRDQVCYDLLQACGTGHDGSMGTIHSNDPNSCVIRMNNLVLQAGLDMPSKSVNTLIAGSVDLIIQISRLKDGSRKITHITEVVEYVPETDMVRTEDIYRWELESVDKNGKQIGTLLYTGYVPTTNLLDKLERSDYNFHELVKGSDVE